MTTPVPAGGRREHSRTDDSRSPRLASLFASVRAVPDWAILLLFFGLILVQAIPSLQQESATYDELLRQLPGYLHLTAGEYRIHTEHPPLVKMLAALPLLFMDVKIPPVPDPWSDVARWKWHQDFLYVANDADRLVFLGRLAVLPLTLLLGYFIFRWSKELCGRAAAAFALFLYSFEPNILAHGRLMNTDLAVACFFFMTVYFFFRMVREVTFGRLLSAGLALGLALATKYSAVLVLPILLLLAIAVALSRTPLAVRVGSGPPRIVRERIRKLLVLLASLVAIGLSAYGVIWAMYGFRYVGGTAAGYAYPFSWEQLLRGRSEVEAAIQWAREAKLFPEAYLHGLSIVLRLHKRFAFLMGEISPDGWWYYFLVTFLLKTPLPLLLLVACAAASARAIWRRKGREALFIFLPILVYFVQASVGRLNIGHRHILPIYPFLFVLVSGLIPRVRQQAAVVRGGLTALAVWYVISSAWIFPHYLAYFNELIGGPNQGYKYLVDANLDWGQDLKGLKRYMDDHKISRVWLSYFGTASPDYYGIRYNYLPSPIIFDPKHERVPTPYVAISATNLQGVYFPLRGLNADLFKPLRERQPIAKIGYSIFIYRLD